MGDDLDEFILRDAVGNCSAEMTRQLLRPVERDEGRNGDQ